MRSDCPSIDALWCLVDDQAGSVTQSELLTHVQACASCREELERIDRVTLLDDGTGLGAFAAGQVPPIPSMVLGDRLGFGGAGVVFKAWQPGLGRHVAVKFLPGGPHETATFRRRCIREASAAIRVRHPNVVEIHEVGEAGGYPYIVMEYLGGGTLKERLDAGPLTPRAAAIMAEAVARAVGHVHAQGILHCDLKPANILLDGPCQAPAEMCVPKVSDFGLARSFEDASLANSAAPVGTPHYMAPEQAAGSNQSVGQAADIYSLGAVLYHLLTGLPPFHGSSLIELMDALRHHDPVPPRRLRPGLPRDLETICLKCLEKSPGRRYVTAEAMADDLRRFLQGHPIQARQIHPLEHAWRWSRRNPVVAGLTGALGVTLTAGLCAALALWWRAEAAHQEASAHLRGATSILREIVHIGDPSRPRQEESRLALMRALEETRTLFAYRPDDRDLLITLARIALRLGEMESSRLEHDSAVGLLTEASDLLGRYSATSPDDREASRLRVDGALALGTVLRSAGRQDDAVALYSAASHWLEDRVRRGDDPELRPRLARLRCQWAQVEFERSRFIEQQRLLKDAAAELSEYLVATPGDAEALLLQAYCLGEQGKSTDSLAVFRQAYEADPHSPATRNAFGNALYDYAGGLNNPDMQLSLLGEAVELLDLQFEESLRNSMDDPEDVIAHRALYEVSMRLGFAYGSLGRFAEADRSLDIAIQQARFIEVKPMAAKELILNFNGKAFHFAKLRSSQAGDEEIVKQTIDWMTRTLALFGNLAGEPDLWQMGLARVFLDLAQHRRYGGQLEQADDLIARAGVILDGFARTNSGRSDYLALQSERWNQIAKQCLRRHDFQGALDARTRSLRSAQTAFEISPESPTYKQLLDDRLRRLGDLQAECGQEDLARATHTRRRALGLNSPPEG